MRLPARPVPKSPKNNAIAAKLARFLPVQVLEDEHEHRAVRVLSFRGMARKRLLRRFPRTDFYG